VYPQRELKRLAAHKFFLRRRIADRRVQCAAAAGHLARPLAWLDRVLTFWRKLAPLTRMAAVPLGLLVRRKLFPRMNVIGSLMCWAPPVLRVWRAFRANNRG
jgi:hypothetical protein